MKRWVGIGIKILVVAVLAGSFIWGLYSRAQKNKRFDYSKVLDHEAFSLDGESVKFKDLAFFIAYEERIVEEEAKIYNKESTKDYWNTHTNGQFISVAARDAVMDMAIHDYLMYNLAQSEGVRLKQDQIKEVENSTLDFWMDLLDGQKESLLSYTTEEAIDEILMKKALAEIYQDYLAVVNNHAYVYYDVGGKGYEDILSQHDVKISKEWKDVVMGEITIHHDKVNYATGYDHD